MRLYTQMVDPHLKTHAQHIHLPIEFNDVSFAGILGVVIMKSALILSFDTIS